MSETPQRARVFMFLREQRGIAFCADCLANAVGATSAEVREHLKAVREGAVEVGRGRCTVCRAETEVARHKLH